MKCDLISILKAKSLIAVSSLKQEIAGNLNMNKVKEWGFLREDNAKAIKAGIDKQTGLPRTGMDEYLEAIFPDTNDWVHDKTTGLKENTGKKSLKRPDWRSESLKIIIEFDGIDHYRSPKQILKDKESNIFYKRHGYKVVRIPYFIQLTNDAVKTLFDVNVKQQLFSNNIPSLGIEENGAPACLCPSGIKRMAEEFHKFPQQYKINIDNLKKINNEFLSGCSLLEDEYNKIK